MPLNYFAYWCVSEETIMYWGFQFLFHLGLHVLSDAFFCLHYG